eukprot:CAMPEP_0175053254 /NCGR_PEP_ID=MMETSP0052_2-20121109/8819_1 /TAXON_ID=51329 ORGANISM="Polytomella parva, Strain SAG 63-3" /NCGR_SAMPLE_ID=MMETSP0052_2 /ASSEMBLY_ACC=CAM_ASM_000194 /LENGTH=508 /DNA_ID=CAMNT_0016317761 /DNA_START=232 /DNA_END=1755 /DNA_ORIENTATION=+
MSGKRPAKCENFVSGKWLPVSEYKVFPDPLNGEPFLSVPNTSFDETKPFIASLKSVTKSGLHNPFKSPERYVMYGGVSKRVAQELGRPEVSDFFARLIQRVAPKSYKQAAGEVAVTRAFFENFSGDQVRFLARGFSNPGDHPGQMSSGYRWPYGPVTLIAPFNFPLEIPALQAMGALFMGNKPLVHVDARVSVVFEQLVRLLLHCGMPAADLDLLHGPGPTMGHVIRQAKPRNTLFTGSQRVAELLAEQTHGRLFLEDAGFDWKLLGPDAAAHDAATQKYVAWQCDQDAYACSGQKCSAQSILFAHTNWSKGTQLFEQMKEFASRRKLSDLTIGPVLSWTTENMLKHVEKLKSLPGAYVMFGGEALSEPHSIPAVYGAVQPTAVFVPLTSMLASEEAFALCTTEVFGPFQVVTEWSDGELPLVLEALERMENHLTAAVVSNDVSFQRKVLEATVNGTTYCGIRARTTGAPQNHWFGPCGDPRGAGIGTPEAIRLVWSCHREIIKDEGP